MLTNVLLLGLDDAVAAELAPALYAESCTTTAAPFTNVGAAAEHVSDSAADVVFCDADSLNIRRLMKALRARGCAIPVVIASRVPNVGRWLDALDAGAWDYCAAPFEPRTLRHILEGALRFTRNQSYGPVLSSTTIRLT